MFKNHAVRLQVVKNTKPQDTSVEDANQKLVDRKLFNELMKDQLKTLAILAIVVFAANAVVGAVSEIAVIAAKEKLR